VTLLRALATAEPSVLLRVYWYDGAFEADDARYPTQRPYLDAVVSCPGIQISLFEGTGGSPLPIRGAVQHP
jgi:hypothetical protein